MRLKFLTGIEIEKAEDIINLMETQNNLQLELFSQTKDFSALRPQKTRSPFLAYIWNYEKAILIIICLIVTSIISFSLGVEKGKRLSMLKNIRLDTASTTADSNNALFPKKQSPPVLIKKDEGIKESSQIEKQGYIIQLASYKTKTHAQEEIELLRKRGLSPLVLSKGNYTVLCVGNFSNREIAQSLLSELKKRYKDCYIRRL